MVDQGTNHNTVIWCFGERSKYAHAYPGEAGIKCGVPLCGTKCIPVTELTHWDLSRKEIRDISCPICLERLHLAAFLKPLNLSHEETTEKHK